MSLLSFSECKVKTILSHIQTKGVKSILFCTLPPVLCSFKPRFLPVLPFFSAPSLLVFVPATPILFNIVRAREKYEWALRLLWHRALLAVASGFAYRGIGLCLLWHKSIRFVPSQESECCRLASFGRLRGLSPPLFEDALLDVLEDDEEDRHHQQQSDGSHEHASDGSHSQRAIAVSADSCCEGHGQQAQNHRG